MAEGDRHTPRKARELKKRVQDLAAAAERSPDEVTPELEKTAQAAKTAAFEAEERVQRVEREVAKINQARGRLSAKQQALLDSLSTGEAYTGGRNVGSTRAALERKGLVEGGKLTGAGRDVGAARLRAAEERLQAAHVELTQALTARAATTHQAAQDVRAGTARREGRVGKGNAAEYARRLGGYEDEILGMAGKRPSGEYERDDLLARQAEAERQREARRAAPPPPPPPPPPPAPPGPPPDENPRYWSSRWPRTGTPLTPRPTTGPRAAIERLGEQEAKAAARIEKERERRETGRLTRAAAREADAHDEAARAAEQQAIASRDLAAAQQRNAAILEQGRLGRQQLTPGSAGGGGRDVIAHIDRQQAEANRKAIEAQQRAYRASAGGGGAAVTAHIDKQEAEGNRQAAEAQQEKEAVRARRQAENQAAAAGRAEAAAQQRHAANLDIVAQSQERLTAAQGQSRAALGQAVAQWAAADDRLRRFGALSTEAIDAARAGTLTYREWGWQIGSTAAKFAGWTAVSIPVFAAIEGIRRLGSGAIESASGINELQRFISNLDTNKAQQQFRDLSDEFNLPIGDVTEAYAQMGRVFNSQDEALKGATAVLTAVRVGELEVADATRFLGAIVQGFRLPADQLTTVIDQINQAQNTLNFSIRDGAAGIARAAGSWRAAGGDFSSLLAIMATAQRSTGATGEVVGTALRRSAEFIGRGANQQALRGFGIDPTTTIDRVYAQAFEKVRSGQVAGQDVTRLATALSSPQLAAVIGPTLQNFELYDRALQKTNATASKGSAQRELAIQLASVQERLKAVGVALEQLGSNLAQAGFLDLLIGGVEVLNRMLDVVNGVFAVFNSLPTPLRHALAIFAQLYGLMRIARRVDLGARFEPGSTAHSLFTDPRRGERLGARDLRDRERAIAEEFQRTAVQSRSAALRHETAQRRFERENTIVLPGENEEATAARRARFGVAMHRAAEKADDLALETDYLRQEMSDARDDVRHYKSLSRDEKLGLLTQRQVYGTPDFDRPVGSRPGPSPATTGLAPGQLAFDLGGTSTRAAAETAETVAKTEAAAVQQSRLARARANLAEAIANEGLIMGVGNQATLRLSDAAGRLTAKAGTARAGAARLASRLKVAASSLIGMFGPLEIGFAAFIAGIAGLDAIKDSWAADNSFDDAMLEDARSSKELQGKLDQARHEAKRGNSIGDTLRNFPKDFLDAAIGEGVGDILPYQRAEKVRQTKAQRDANQIEELQRQQRLALFGGDVIPQATLDQIDKFNRDTAKAIQDKSISLGELDRRTTNVITSIRISRTLTPQQRLGRISAAAQIQYDAQPENKTGRLDLLEEFTEQDLNDRLDSFKQLMESGRATEKDIDEFIRESLEVARRNSGRGPQARARRAQALAGIGEGIIGEAQRRRDEALGRATTETQRQAAERRYGSDISPRGIRAAERPIQRDLIRKVRATADNEARAREELANVGSDLPGDDLSARAARFLRRAELLQKIKDYQEDREKLSKDLDNSQAQIAQAIRETADDRRQARIDVYERGAARRDLHSQLRQSRRPEGLGRTRQALRDISAEIEAAIVAYGSREAPEVLQLINQQQELINQEAEDIRARIEAAQRLSEVRAPESQRGGLHVQHLRENLASAVSEGRDQADIDNLKADIVEAEEQNAEDAKARAEERRAKAQATIESLYALRIAKTEDPVRRAELEAQRDQKILGLGGDPNTRRQNQATSIESKRAVRDARIQAKLDTLGFRHDMDKLSDEAYARSLQHIARTLEMPKELRRRLLVEAHNLLKQQDNEVDLDVGNIRLPTIYEVRRLVKTAAGSAPKKGRAPDPAALLGGTNATTINQYNTIHVNGATDPETTGAHINHVLTTHGKASMRAAGFRG